MCEYGSSRTHGKLSGTRVAYFTRKSDKTHVRRNSESESEGFLKETRQEKPGRTESLSESESERREELELSKVQEMCLRNPGNNDDGQVAVQHADASGGDIRENPARREQNEKHPS